MDFSKYKYFYVNGCSHTEGGGLEEPKIKKNSVIPIYEKKYAITWKNRKEINFGKRLEEIIGIKCINDAKSGSGVDRMVRTTYEFINNHWKEKDNFFIILERPDETHSEVFYNELNEYVIVNSVYDDKTFQSAAVDYYNPKYVKTENDLYELFKNWFKNHYNFTEKFKNDEKAFVGLYSFCKVNNIKIFIMSKNFHYFVDTFDEEDLIKFDNKYPADIWNFATNNKLTISDETDGEYMDGHPGYFGHIEYAKRLANFLGWDGKYPEYPIYKRKII